MGLTLACAIPFLQAVLPVDASCEDIEVDPDLPFRLVVGLMRG